MSLKLYSCSRSPIDLDSFYREIEDTLRTKLEPPKIVWLRGLAFCIAFTKSTNNPRSMFF